MADKINFPFATSRPLMWRKCGGNEDPSAAVRLPSTIENLKKLGNMSSTQQLLGVQYIKNEIAVSLASCGSPTLFHLGGLPGSGKTATVTSLIRELDCHLLASSKTVLMCSKTNAAKFNLISSCAKEDETYFNESAFSTVNSGFAIPVIKTSADMEDDNIPSYAEYVKNRIVQNSLGELDVIIKDEYTMTNAIETVYIDCIMRVVRCRPNTPFGGATVIFMGDNRQNSTVVERQKRTGSSSSSSACVTAAAAAAAPSAAGTFDNDVSSVLLKTLKNLFYNPKHCIDVILLKGLKSRLELLEHRKCRLNALINDTLQTYRDKGTSNKRSADVTPPVTKRLKKSDDDSFPDFDISDDDFERLIRDAENSGPAADKPVTAFAKRAREAANANSYFRERAASFNAGGGGGNGDPSVTTLSILKNLSTFVLVEEGVRHEIERINQFLRMDTSHFKLILKDIFDEIVSFGEFAMREIDFSRREKFFVVSSITETVPDRHLMSMVNEEILNVKLCTGQDQECIDALPCFIRESIRVDMAVNCINNMFYRDGIEFQNEIPAAVFMMQELDNVCEFLNSEDLTAAQLVERAQNIADRLLTVPATGASASASGGSGGGDYDDCSDDDDDDDYYEEKASSIVVRNDVPDGIRPDATTPERARTMTRFAPMWAKKMASLSDITRARFWNLGVLVRLARLGWPKQDDATAVGLFHLRTPQVPPLEPYWLRGLSMPVITNQSGNDDMLSAYSSYISSIARTFIISSLKRVNIGMHSHGLMYSTSLFDMTTDVLSLIDSRTLLPQPIGFEDCPFKPSEYVEGIFPSVLRDFLVVDENSIYSTANRIQLSEGNVIDLRRVEQERNRINSETRRRNCIPKKASAIATCIISSIALGNIEKMKSEKNTDAATASLASKVLSPRAVAAATAPASEINKKKLGSGMGAVALTRSHNQKNSISELVDAVVMANIDKGSTGKSTTSDDLTKLKTTRFATEYIVCGIDMSNIGPAMAVSHTSREVIASHCKNARRNNKVVIDRFVDYNLVKNVSNAPGFTKTLVDFKNNIARVRYMDLFVGQNVVFTHTNKKPSPYGTDVMFFTTDTGVVVDVSIKNNTLAVSVFLDRTLETIRVQPGHESFGRLINGSHGASIRYLPINSNKVMTIYSSQGQTLWRDTIVDLTNASNQDSYVAITRNGNVLNLKVFKSSDADVERLSSIKVTMGKDRTHLFSLGGLREKTSVDSNCFFSLFSAKEFLRSLPGSTVAIFDRSRDVIAAVQRFVMDRTDNSFSFNAKWFARTAKMLKTKRMEKELKEIDDFFFMDAERDAEHYADKTWSVFMELYECTVRSVVHYSLFSNQTRKPSQSVIADDKSKERGYAKIHPLFTNKIMKSKTFETLFFDVAPHSLVMQVFQVFAHFIFLVNENFHICNSSFAFLPNTSPLVNSDVRCAHINQQQDPQDGTKLEVPGGLGFESNRFIDSKDGGVRNSRMAITNDEVRRDIFMQKLRNRVVAETEKESVGLSKLIAEGMTYNLRRKGKYCRPQEACGLNRHGSIVVACDTDTLEESTVYHDKSSGNVSYSYEANLYSMIRLMTMLAAASGIYRLNPAKILGPEWKAKDRLVAVTGAADTPPALIVSRIDDEILFCGQCYPMSRVQFLIHTRIATEKETKHAECSSGDDDELLLPVNFEKIVTQGRGFSGAKLVILTDMLGREFAAHSTSKVRQSLSIGGAAGKTFVQEIKGDGELGRKNTLEKVTLFIVKTLTKKIRFTRVSFFVSATVADS